VIPRCSNLHILVGRNSSGKTALVESLGLIKMRIQTEVPYVDDWSLAEPMNENLIKLDLKSALN
jgi:AAA15 family ATPase/GTPase